MLHLFMIFMAASSTPHVTVSLTTPILTKVLIDTAVAKAHGTAYRPDYLRNHNKAFLPLVMSMMMMMFIGSETLVTQLVCEISRMQAC